MIINIPAVRKEFSEDGKTIKVTRYELPVEIDMSFLANLKWEEHFQSTMGCDLITYTERVKKWSLDKNAAKAHFVGMLKLLYCYVNSDKLPTFMGFAKLFDYEVMNEILDKLTVVFKQLEKSASKN